MNNIKSNVKISRRRVNELVVERLEVLAKKQRLRRPVPRICLRGGGKAPSEATIAKNAKFLAHMKEMKAKMEARQKKEPLSTQARRLTESICRQACTRKRPSFGKEVGYAKSRQEMEQGSITVIGLPPRTRETGPTLRCLDRSEARLLRLVQAWAVTEAQKEQEAQKEADAL